MPCPPTLIYLSLSMFSAPRRLEIRFHRSDAKFAKFFANTNRLALFLPFRNDGNFTRALEHCELDLIHMIEA